MNLHVSFICFTIIITHSCFICVGYAGTITRQPLNSSSSLSEKELEQLDCLDRDCGSGDSDGVLVEGFELDVLSTGTPVVSTKDALLETEFLTLKYSKAKDVSPTTMSAPLIMLNTSISSIILKLTTLNPEMLTNSPHSALTTEIRTITEFEMPPNASISSIPPEVVTTNQEVVTNSPLSILTTEMQTNDMVMTPDNEIRASSEIPESAPEVSTVGSSCDAVNCDHLNTVHIHLEPKKEVYKINEDEMIYFKCWIERNNQTNFTMFWEKINGTNFGTVNTKQPDVLEWSINSTKVNDSGIYRCHASVKSACCDKSVSQTIELQVYIEPGYMFQIYILIGIIAGLFVLCVILTIIKQWLVKKQKLMDYKLRQF